MKLILHIFIASVLIPNFLFAQVVDLNSGLIGCYPFSGNANDLSVSANHGKISGAKLTQDRFGKDNSAFNFDGVDDFIEISPDILKLNNFSYSIWVSPSQLPTSSSAFFLFSVGSDYGDQHILLGNQYTNGRHNSFAHGSYQGVAQNVQCTDNTLAEINTWYHLALVKDAGNYYFYVNGRLICSNPVLGQSAFYGLGTVRATIGARNNYGQASNAKIDDIHLYNRAISLAEIELLYHGFEDNREPLVLNVNKNNPCQGDTITISSDIPSRILWRVDGSLTDSGEPSQLTINLPEKDTAYELIVDAELVSQNPTCFNLETQKTTQKILVGQCNIPEDKIKKLLIPSIFTPNKDGHNDVWIIRNWESVDAFEIYIYNRWGSVIYHSQKYDTPWDGKYSGKIVSNGIYPYIILSNKHKITFGTVTIIY